MRQNQYIRHLFLTVITAVLFLVWFVVPLPAQESAMPDSISLDSLNTDPEWYVAPIIPSSLRAPMRSNAAESCNTDSILTYDIDSVLTGVTAYTYDEAGRTICTAVWSCAADGSRTGISKNEDRYNESGTKVMTSTYVWDNTTNDWKGNEKTEYEFANGKNTVTTVFDWLNGAWSAKTKYTYSYDAAGREIEYYEYSRNASLQLVYSKGRIREYNTNAKLILEIQYSAHNGTDWSAGTKKVYDYDASGNQIEYTYYSSLSNGNWVGSTHEEWTYNAANKKTYYAKQTWKNGNWSNSSKEVYEYNAANKQTLKIVYTGSGTTWTESTKEVSDYNAAGSKTLSAKYKWKNGAWVGNGSRTETEYVGSKQSVVVTSSWSTAVADWIYATRHSYTYDGAGKTIADTTKTYTNSAWVNNALVTHVFDDKGNDTLAVTSAWNGTDWTAASITKGTYTYTASGLPLLAETYTGLGEVWIGNQKIEYAYNEAGSQTLYISYDWYNGDWRGKQKTEKEYDANNRLILSENYTWRNSAWAGNNKSEYAYDTYGRQCMTAQYTWSNNDWKGLSKTEQTMDANGVVQTSISYTWRENDWVGIFKYDYTYDNAGHTTDKVIYYFQNNQWGNDQRYTYAFDARGQEIYSHEYRWVNGNWQMISAHEKTYDEADNKLRRDITGSWNTNGNVSSYTDMHYFYACDPHYYTIRFVNYDGTELSSESILEGETPVYNGEDPTKPEDTQYTYTFSGWTPSLVPVTGNATYTATYSSTPRQYTITWLNEDGSEISHETLEYGATPAHADINKESTAEFTYTFAGWTPGIGIVTGDATYQATFKATKNSYTVTWLNSDNSPLSQSTVEYGVTPTAPSDPTKASTAEYSYTFTGWSPAITAVTGEATYTATFTQSKRKYTVTWLNEDGSIIAQEELEFGATPAHADINKESTAEYTYTFSGWTPTIAEVTGDATYTATFTATKNKYLITFKDDDGSILKSEELEYGVTPVAPEDPTKGNTAEYSYTFSGWDKEVVSVTEAATYTATFDSVKNTYTVTWLNSDNSPLVTNTVEYGTMPVEPTAPTKPADSENTYTFAGWTPEIAAVTGDATYTATFTATKNSYTITWKNEDGSVIASETLEYGTTPAHADINKESTAEYDYTFTGWTPEIVSVTGDAEYTATFSATKNKYLVTFKDEDGTTLQSEELEYGVLPSTPSDPTKASTAEYTYAFKGWSPQVVAVTGDATYTATFAETKRNYTVTWLNSDNSPLVTNTVEYGTMPVEPTAPTKPADSENTYTFVGWTPQVVSVTCDAEYTATFTATKNSYTITWLNSDNSPLATNTVEYGQVPAEPTTPTKQSTAEYTYTFSGWTPEIVSVTGDAEYTATFSATKNKYLVTFKDEDGTTLQSEELEYGVLPTAPADPTKANTAEYTYTFSGWDKEVVSVTEAATYTATYAATKNSYTITWLNSDNSPLSQSTVEYGAMPVHDAPTKVSTAEYDYTFAGWSPEIVPVTGDATYTATFDSIKNSYAITWLNSDNSPLSQSTVEYGVIPTHADVTRPDANGYHYTFSGWTPTITSVTGNATYKATYDSILTKCIITFYFENGETVLDQVEVAYGETPHTDLIPSKNSEEHYYYTFDGWYPEIVPATGNASYVATYKAIPQQYTITFKNYNGWELEKTTAGYGTIPVYTGETPTKPKDKHYTYVFAGWSPELTEVTGPATYTAVFEGIVNQYTVIFLDADGTELDRQEVDYGIIPSPAVIPTKEDDAQYTYTFAGWNPKLTTVTRDATYKATYSKRSKTQGLEEQTPSDSPSRGEKVLRNGHIYILRGGKTFTLDGIEVNE